MTLTEFHIYLRTTPSLSSGALAAQVYTKVFMGATIDVNMLHMFKQIALFVFVPLFAGLVTQFLGIKKYGEPLWNQKIKPKFVAPAAVRCKK